MGDVDSMNAEAPRALHPHGGVGLRRGRQVSPARDRAALAGKLGKARAPLRAAGRARLVAARGKAGLTLKRGCGDRCAVEQLARCVARRLVFGDGCRPATVPVTATATAPLPHALPPASDST